MVVRKSVRRDLEYLCDCLGEADRLTGADALKALAAFLRVRLQEGGAEPALDLGERVLGVAELSAAAERFVVRHPEEGRRGQALVAAALSLAFDDVRTSRVNDPSRHWPGDVAVVVKNVFTMAAEAKQRPVPAAEVLPSVSDRASKMVARGDNGGRPSRADLPRSQALGRAEHDPRWRERARRHVDLRAPERRDLPAVQHRTASRPSWLAQFGFSIESRMLSSTGTRRTERRKACRPCGFSSSSNSGYSSRWSTVLQREKAGLTTRANGRRAARPRGAADLDR